MKKSDIPLNVCENHSCVAVANGRCLAVSDRRIQRLTLPIIDHCDSRCRFQYTMGQAISESFMWVKN